MTTSAEFGSAPRNVVIDLEVGHRARAPNRASRCPYMHVRAVRALTVRFEAGGIDEMCLHLLTWGESVTIEEPLRLRRRLSEMNARMAAHHGGQLGR